MKKYKAVIIDFKRTARLGATAVMAILICALMTSFAGYSLKTSTIKPETILERNISVMDVVNGDGEAIISFKDIAHTLMNVFMGFDATDATSVIESNLPICAVVSEGGLVSASRKSLNKSQGESQSSNDAKTEEEIKIPKENQAPIKEIDASEKKGENMPVAIGNETSYGIDMADMMSRKPKIDMGKSGPKILITHTHATESYAPYGTNVYDVTAGDRSEDKDKNVVAVGEKMAETFREYGIEVIHDKILHDVPSFNGSYAHSLETVLDYKEQYPSVQIVFDVHRDSIVYDDKTKAKTVCEIDGKKVAQLMFVVGTDENGLYHPQWRENIRSAIWFQCAITERYPSLMRHINLRKERFNGHTCSGAMIIEAGTSGNTLDEALAAIELATECIAQELLSY